MAFQEVRALAAAAWPYKSAAYGLERLTAYPISPELVGPLAGEAGEGVMARQRKAAQEGFCGAVPLAEKHPKQ